MNRLYIKDMIKGILYSKLNVPNKLMLKILFQNRGLVFTTLRDLDLI